MARRDDSQRIARCLRVATASSRSPPCRIPAASCQASPLRTFRPTARERRPPLCCAQRSAPRRRNAPPRARARRRARRRAARGRRVTRARDFGLLRCRGRARGSGLRRARIGRVRSVTRSPAPALYCFSATIELFFRRANRQLLGHLISLACVVQTRDVAVVRHSRFQSLTTSPSPARRIHTEKWRPRRLCCCRRWMRSSRS
jgi:hypothetical protein